MFKISDSNSYQLPQEEDGELVNFKSLPLRHNQIVNNKAKTLGHVNSLNSDNDEANELGFGLASRTCPTDQKLTKQEIYEIFQNAFIRMKGYLMFSKLYREIQDFGTSPNLCTLRKRRNTAFTWIAVDKIRTHYFRKDKKKLTNLGVLFHPDSKCKQYWNVIMLLLLFYVFTAMPWIMAFQDVQVGDNLYYVETSVDLLFSIDIIVTLNTAYFEKNQILVTNRLKIFWNYFTGLMIIDVVTIMPFLLATSGGRNRSNSLIRVVRIIKVSRIFRATKLSKIFENVQSSEILTDFNRFLKQKKALVRLIVVVCIILIMAHFFACMWYWTAKLENFAYDTWVLRYGWADLTKVELYLKSLYFAFTILTTVGFGDITASTNTEQILVIGWMLFGIGFYSFFIGTLSSIIVSYDVEKTALNEKIGKIEDFSRKFMLSKDLCKKLKKVIRKVEKKYEDNDEGRLEVIKKLPIKYKYRIAIEMNNHAVQKIPFFRDQSVTFLCDIVPKLNTNYVEENNFIYRKGDHPEEIYFIVDGRASYVHGQDNFVYKYIITGSYFGDIEFIKNCKRMHSVMAETNTFMLTMNHNLYSYMIETYPNTYKYLKDNADIKIAKCIEALKSVMKLVAVTERSKPRNPQGTIVSHTNNIRIQQGVLPDIDKEVFVRKRAWTDNLYDEDVEEDNISDKKISNKLDKLERGMNKLKIDMDKYGRMIEKIANSCEQAPLIKLRKSG